MQRLACLTWMVLTVLANNGLGAEAGTLVSNADAARVGLTRSWFAQIGAPAATGPVTHVNYDGGLVIAANSRGRVTAIDPETGRTMWTTQVGPMKASTTAPAANDDYVVVINGSTIYVLDRQTGEITWEKRLSGAPGAGAAVSPTHAFVPLISGKIEGYELAKGVRQDPWNYKSAGRVLVSPLATSDTVSWTTERGYLYAGSSDASGIRYRLETRGAIHARPGSWAPYLYACSSDGYVYAVNEARGAIEWKFAMGEPVFEPPVAISDKVYVVSDVGGMYCLDAKNGHPLWHTSHVQQFVSASPTRVYVCDSAGRLKILDGASGQSVGTMTVGSNIKKVVNSRSDRIFLASDSIVQGLHEMQLKTPVLYTPPSVKKQERKIKLRERPTESAVDSDAEAAEEPTADEMSAEAEMPEEGAAEEPAAEPAADDSPDPFAPPNPE